MSKPKILLFDIETKPLIVYSWNVHDTYISPDDIIEDWSILAWSAKWLGEDEIFYEDLSHVKDKTKDKQLIKHLWELLDEAQVVVGQNSKKFDEKKVNARFIEHGYKPPSSYKSIDTRQIAKKKFGFTSNALKQLTEKLNEKHRKKDHSEFPGNTLWRECLKDNPRAWAVMKDYNVADVLALEELFNKLHPWDNSLNPSVYLDNEEQVCQCGNDHFQRNGYHYTNTSKFQRFKCSECGAETRSRVNLFNKDKRDSIRVKV